MVKNQINKAIIISILRVLKNVQDSKFKVGTRLKMIKISNWVLTSFIYFFILPPHDLKLNPQGICRVSAEPVHSMHTDFASTIMTIGERQGPLLNYKSYRKCIYIVVSYYYGIIIAIIIVGFRPLCGPTRCGAFTGFPTVVNFFNFQMLC